MIPTLFKVNVQLVCSLRNKLPGPWGLYNYICILEKLLCHLNSSNSVAFTGITDFSGRDTGKHCSKDTPLLTQLPLFQSLSWVIPTLQSLGLRLPGCHGLKFAMQPEIPILSDLSGWNFVTSWLSEWLPLLLPPTQLSVQSPPYSTRQTWRKSKFTGLGSSNTKSCFPSFFSFSSLQQEGRMVTMLKDQQLSPSHPIHVVEHPLCGYHHQKQCLALLILFILNQSSRDHTAHPMQAKIQLSFSILCISRSELQSQLPAVNA